VIAEQIKVRRTIVALAGIVGNSAIGKRPPAGARFGFPPIERRRREQAAEWCFEELREPSLQIAASPS
jgi:hypothetical protein